MQGFGMWGTKAGLSHYQVHLSKGMLRNSAALVKELPPRGSGHSRQNKLLNNSTHEVPLQALSDEVTRERTVVYGFVQAFVTQSRLHDILWKSSDIFGALLQSIEVPSCSTL
jgi:hypothetical protein